MLYTIRVPISPNCIINTATRSKKSWRANTNGWGGTNPMHTDRTTHLFERPPVCIPVTNQDTHYAVRRVYCVGRNYVSHIQEMKEGDERDPPFFFQKPTDAIVLDQGNVRYPPDTCDLQHEVELVVALGRQGRNIPRSKALDYAFGYAVGLDMTRRDRQIDARNLRRPWEIGKSFDNSAPCGPIRKAADSGHKMTGAICLSVNGELRQSGNLAEMIWNIPEIIANLSTMYELYPGDMIFTGTPAGVGPVDVGDSLVGTIDGLPSLTVTIEHEI